MRQVKNVGNIERHTPYKSHTGGKSKKKKKNEQEMDNFVNGMVNGKCEEYIKRLQLRNWGGK